MATIYNRIMIQAAPEEVWAVLADPAKLDQYDPIVRKSRLISSFSDGLGAERHCDTLSGWFNDKITEWLPYEKLTFALTGCNQPMKSLTHSYTLKRIGNQTEVSQVMNYTMKFGILGRLMDTLLGKRESDKQIKKFFVGLKNYIEKRRTENEG
jgi:ribosome-associated toxin RatA of RatAB toxin-antitoxin module